MSRPGLLISYGLRDASKSRIVLLLIVTSLSVAFATVLASASVLDGFKTILVDGAIGTFGDLTITPENGVDTIPNVEDTLAKIKRVDNVEYTSLKSTATFGLEYKGVSSATGAVEGIVPVDENKITNFEKGITDGRFLSPSSHKEVVLGLSIADSMVGDTFDKTVPTIGDYLQVTSFAGEKEDFKIVGITDTKGFMGNLMVFFNKQDVDDLDPAYKDSEIIIKLADRSKIDATKKAIEDLGLPIQVSTWQEEAGYVNDIVSVVSFIMLTINRLLIVSVFIIISIIVFINVFQKRRQIGILKSMGTNNRFIVGIYMFETLIYTLLSYLIGYLIFMLMYLYSSEHVIPTLIGDFALVYNQDSIISTSIILLVAAVAGSFIPSFIAAKTRIIETLNSNV